jgi:hypothetical protein
MPTYRLTSLASQTASPRIFDPCSVAVVDRTDAPQALGIARAVSSRSVVPLAARRVGAWAYAALQCGVPVTATSRAWRDVLAVAVVDATPVAAS